MKLVKMKIPQMASYAYGAIDPNYRFVDVVDNALHIEMTDYTAYDIFGMKTGRDMMFLRDELAAKAAAEGFSNIVNDYDKKIVARYAACSKADALTVLSAQERKYFNKQLVTNLKIARAQRIEHCRQVVGNLVLDGDLTYADSNDLLDKTSEIFNSYINGSDTKFVDWLNSSAPYNANGFSFQSYYTVELKDELIDITVNGKIDI